MASGEERGVPTAGGKEDGSTHHCDLLLSNGFVVTMDAERRVLETGTVAIAGDRIVAVGTPQELTGWNAGRVVDCRGAAVLPGLVDCHNHLFQGLSRGLGDGHALWTWLTELIWPYAALIEPAEARAAAMLGAVEAARAGTTSLLDNHYSPPDAASTLAMAEALEDVGLRGVVARGIFGPPTDAARSRGLPETLFRFDVEREIEETRVCMDARPARSRVEVWPAPINPTYIDERLLRMAVELARQGGVRWHTHCSETGADAKVTSARFGLRPVEWLEREGVLEDATLAHGVWLDDAEIGALARAGAGVAHCPVANQYLASGTIPLRKLREAGVTVGLGTDGPGGGQREDLFECMKSAVLLQRVSTLDPRTARAEDALELATLGGAAFLRIDAGVLAPGMLADITIVDLTLPHARPLHRVAPILAYSARGADVRMTIVGGDVIVEEGHCTKVEESAVVEEAEARARALVTRAGMETFLERWASPGS